MHANEQRLVIARALDWDAHRGRDRVESVNYILISPSRQLGVVLGALGTALLHTLLVLPFFLDLFLSPHRFPDHSGGGASALASTEEPLMTVVFIDEVSPAVERLAPLEPRDLASRGVELPDIHKGPLETDASSWS